MLSRPTLLVISRIRGTPSRQRLRQCPHERVPVLLPPEEPSLVTCHAAHRVEHADEVGITGINAALDECNALACTTVRCGNDDDRAIRSNPTRSTSETTSAGAARIHVMLPP